MGLDRSPEQLIKAGLAALKQKNYERAIATFQKLRQTDNVSASHRLKAQMGLIRVYEAQGNNEEAQRLCQPLLKSRSQSIRQWAHGKAQQLSVDPSCNNEPFNNTEATATKSPIPPTSGFIPLEGDTAANMSTISEEIIQPIEITEKQPASNIIYHQDSKEVRADSADAVPTDEISEHQSLFHYQTLNHRQEVIVDNNSQSKETSVLNHSVENQSISASVQAPSEDSDQADKTLKSAAELSVSRATGPDTWPQGERLKTLKSLGKVNTQRLWFAQIATIPLLFLVLRWLIQTGLTLIRSYLLTFNDLLPIRIQPAQFFWESHTWTVVIGLGLLTLAAPWLWPWLLRPQASFTSKQLHTYSPEAVQLLRRYCTKKRWTFPTMHLLASDLPIIFSCGWHPRCGRLVISQGLLDSLEPDELGAIFMYEISHWASLDWIFFSTHGLLLGGCHRVYWWLAKWGEHRPKLIKVAAGTLATLSYIIFWLLGKVGCSLARTRAPYRDRRAVELTGNPNGLARALAKMAYEMDNAIVKQSYTPPLLESLALLLPVTHHPATSIQHFAWGAFNPLRHWLSINQGHPPLGDRLHTLSAYSRHWRLKPSVNFAQLRLKQGSRRLTLEDWRNLLLQGGVWSGLILGLAIALLMWLVGAVSTSFDVPLLAWLYQDRSILIGIPLIGAATVQILRLNRFFPDISTSLSTSEAQLTAWQTDSQLIPLSSPPIKISGTVTGRPALANWLGQEWRLTTADSSIKLHYTGYLGPFSNRTGLISLLNEPLEITGWFRRGHYSWIDLEHVRSRQNQRLLARHPIWSLITSLLPLGYGIWLIFRGG